MLKSGFWGIDFKAIDYDQILDLEVSYDVFKRIKEVSVNVKTDWNYPNSSNQLYSRKIPSNIPSQPSS